MRTGNVGFVDVLLFGVPIATTLIFLIGSLLGRLATRYQILERRIDFSSGIFFRKTDSVWLYEIIDIKFEQPFFLLICRTGQIVIRTEKRTYCIRAIQPTGEMRKLWETLRDAVIAQRRDLKGVWV